MDIYSIPKSPPNFDAVGTFYMIYCVTWTTLVFSGMIFLCINHRNPILKVRGLPMSLTAILLMHAYWILAQVTYPVGLTLPLILAYDVQYFFMGLWFPLGIALFHASNSRFLYVAKLQKQYMQSGTLRKKKSGCNGADSSWLCRLRNLDCSLRILIYVGLGMVVQVCFSLTILIWDTSLSSMFDQVLLTVGMWLACRKYHPTFGVPGTEVHGATIPEQLIDLSRGWEWWPSALWQVIWTWIVAPILLWRAWGIRDTLGWRFQTIGCCLSNLHATPMWLLATYLPAFEPINVYFTPSQWIHLSVMMFEVFTIFVPCWQVLKHRSLRKKAVDSNAKWETASQATTFRGSVIAACKSASLAEKGQATAMDSSDDEMGDRLLTMSALDHTLHENPGPLQEFSALRDFSGENIAFLTRTATWKSSWPASPNCEQIRDLFTRALVIYTDFVSPRDAEFPINLGSQDLKHLECIFEKPARILFGEASVNPATPFDSDWCPRSRGSDSEASGKNGEETGRIELEDLASRVQYTGDISESFNCSVFGKAEAHIKYLVLTNTWPKFVSETRRYSGETERSDDTGVSRSTIVSRVSDLIRSIL
ncbi:putative GprK-type G-protein coupled receptor protein [Biscogniauxia marginata]|nr:putative GprK-type G-protein coupled receptor protein [Biscogniauxia marginata]